MPFMVSCTFVIDQTFVLEVMEKLEISHNENDTMLESKKLRRSSYMALMNKGVATEKCFANLYDSNNTKDMISFVKSVFTRIGLAMSIKKRIQIAGVRHSQYEVLPPRIVFKTALCLKKDNRARLLEMFPILLQTENTSSFDKVWIHECIDECDQVCKLYGCNPTLKSDYSKIRLNIQHRLGVINARMEEEAVIYAINISVQEDAYENESNCTNENEYIPPNNVEDIRFNDEVLDMISIEAFPPGEQVAFANATLAQHDNLSDLRLLANACDKRHLPAQVYKKQKPFSKCVFVNDAAIEGDEYEQVEEDEDDEEDETTNHDDDVDDEEEETINHDKDDQVEEEETTNHDKQCHYTQPGVDDEDGLIHLGRKRKSRFIIQDVE
jgi:hypothetical protein